MLGCVARPGNLGVSTAPANERVVGMSSIVSARQLPPAPRYDLAHSPRSDEPRSGIIIADFRLVARIDAGGWKTVNSGSA